MVQVLSYQGSKLSGQHGKEIADARSKEWHGADRLLHVRLPQAIGYRGVFLYGMGLILQGGFSGDAWRYTHVNTMVFAGIF